MNERERKPFFSHALQVLVNWRIWVIVSAFTLLCLLADLIWGPRASAIAAVPIGLIGSYMLGKLDIDSPDQTYSAGELIHSRGFLCALTGIMIVKGADAIGSLAVLPWHWLYHNPVETHLGAIVSGVCFYLVGIVLAGWCIGTLMPRHAMFAAMMGAAATLTIDLTQLLADDSKYSKIISLGPGLHLFNANDPDFDPVAFKIGFTLGLASFFLIQTLILMFVVRFVSSRASYPLADELK